MGKWNFKTLRLLSIAFATGLMITFVFFWLSNNSDEIKNNKSSESEHSLSGARIETNFGNIEIEFLANTAPVATQNFIKLAGDSFYDGTLFHRVTKDFIQGGDPLTKEGDLSVYGTGGPGYKFDDEVSPDDKILRGSVAMANSGPNTNGSQFFIVAIKEASWLEGNHTVFAKVTRGMDIVDKITKIKTSKNNLPINTVVLERIVLK